MTISACAPGATVMVWSLEDCAASMLDSASNVSKLHLMLMPSAAQE